MQQVRPWLTAHEFNITTFVREGIPASELEATGDSLALTVSQYARDQEAENG